MFIFKEVNHERFGPREVEYFPINPEEKHPAVRVLQ